MAAGREADGGRLRSARWGREMGVGGFGSGEEDRPVDLSRTGERLALSSL